MFLRSDKQKPYAYGMISVAECLVSIFMNSTHTENMELFTYTCS